jgi:hypothetical protein
MWSSSLRDSVPFLPNNEWISWSIKHLMETPNKFKDSYKSHNKIYNSFLSSYKDFFILMRAKFVNETLTGLSIKLLALLHISISRSAIFFFLCRSF